MTLILDSTVVIDMLRGRPASRRLALMIEAGDIPYICAVTADEVQAGVRPAEAARASLVLTSFRTAPLGIMEGSLAGVWRREFAKRGVTLSQSDCLIAAAAVGVHATLATGNPRDFPMEGVAIEHWPVGE